MHDIFQTFVEQLSESVDAKGLRDALVVATASLELTSFAYLFPSPRPNRGANLISTYPQSWTSHYLLQRYEGIDPVVLNARSRVNTFRWGPDCGDLQMSNAQRMLFDEASHFGIRCGFTIPIHDHRGLFAALTFASDERRPLLFRIIDRYERALQLMAILFHSHARCTLAEGGVVDGVRLSRREHQCLQWAAQGKSAWDIGRILGISPRTASFHLDNARKKLEVRTIIQAAVRLARSRPSGFR
ncbi:helix-turn-helix transcriptional regulator [Chelativorans xinjiangense]|uniref:helix-turn-helix transcriptional regulator n=1 Tax=Chelativorans xinjiangense TaxID=2681485 RepID=UPI0013574438|nr:LuxR family transcriptional regulator [Chelativorans xinjiangense]